MPKRVTASASAGPLSTKDSIQNFMARVGLGTDNMMSGTIYTPNFTSRNRFMIESIYRSSWIAGQAVDAIAIDMTREGVTVKGAIEPTDIEKLEREMTALRVWKGLLDVAKWARLYGGAVGFLMVDGQRSETPLRLDTVSKGQFKGVLPLDRWMLQPLFDEWVTDYGPDYGKPKFYTTIRDNMGMRSMKIHYSRVVRLEGVELPYYQRNAENGWGQSVIERLIDRLIAYDSTTQGTAQLVFKAHLRVLAVKGLRDIIATGGKALEGLTSSVDMIRKFQSNEGLTLIDSEDTLEAQSYTFSGLDAVLAQFGEQISGATGIPLVRLFGQSPAGLSATGESDIRNYYDNVSQQQEQELRNPVTTIYELGYRSTFGRAPPDDFAIDFNSLWQQSDTERATTGTAVTTAITGAFDSGIVGRDVALRELRQASAVTGMWSNITDEMIAEAEEEPPPGAGGLVDPLTGLPLNAPPGAPGAAPDDTGGTTTDPADPTNNDA
jgi:phage-related protein (TIGR01555 family)